MPAHAPGRREGWVSLSQDPTPQSKICPHDPESCPMGRRKGPIEMHITAPARDKQLAAQEFRLQSTRIIPNMNCPQCKSADVVRKRHGGRSNKGVLRSRALLIADVVPRASMVAGQSTAPFSGGKDRTCSCARYSPAQRRCARSARGVCWIIEGKVNYGSNSAAAGRSPSRPGFSRTCGGHSRRTSSRRLVRMLIAAVADDDSGRPLRLSTPARLREVR